MYKVYGLDDRMPNEHSRRIIHYSSTKTNHTGKKISPSEPALSISQLPLLKNNQDKVLLFSLYRVKTQRF